MKSFWMILPVLVLALSSCEKGSRGGKTYDVGDRGNAQKTSVYGGCDYQTECWDYTGSSFQADFDSLQLKIRCQNEGGQFVSNGCTDQNIVASCVINSSSATETVLHFYRKSGLDAQDAEQLCLAQDGTIKGSTPVPVTPAEPEVSIEPTELVENSYF